MHVCHVYFIHFFIVVPYKKDLPFGQCVISLWSILSIAMVFIFVTGLQFLKEIEINNDIIKIIRSCFLFSSLNCIYLFCNILYSKFHTIVSVRSDIYAVILAGVSDVFTVYLLKVYWPSVWQYNISVLWIGCLICELLDSKVHRHHILLELVLSTF